MNGDFHAEIKRAVSCYYSLALRFVLPCIAAPLSGFSHLSAPRRPGNEDLSRLLNLLRHHREDSLKYKLTLTIQVSALQVEENL